MNGPTNDDLTNTLNKRADDFARLGGHDLDLSQVVSRAGEIRRGRRMRATMVMAAVAVAIAVPVGITVVDDDPTRQNNNPPIATNSATPTPTPSQTPDPTPAVDESPLTLDGLKTGAAPATAYWADGKLRFGDVSVPLAERPAGVARIDGGFLYTENRNGDFYARFVSDGGDVLDKDWHVVGGFAVSPGGNVGAFADFNGTVWAVQDGGSRYFEVGDIAAASEEDSFAVAAVRGENCSERSEEPGCTVYANDNGAANVVVQVQPGRDSVQILPEMRSLSTVSPDGRYFAGITSVSDSGSCSEVTDNGENQLAKTCKNTIGSYSPDGSHLLAGPAYLDGPGDGLLAVLDPEKPTLPAVLDLKAGDGTIIVTKRWEDATHFLAVVIQGTEWGVVRVGIDGSRELVLPTVKDSSGDFIPPIVLG